MPTDVTPFLMFDGDAEAAMSLYAAVIEGAHIKEIERYGPGEDGVEGSVKRPVLSLGGQNFLCFDSHVRHDFTFTPAFSLFVNCASEEELDRLLAQLSEDGNVFMPPDTYGFSRKFAWISDRFGISWQLNLP